MVKKHTCSQCRHWNLAFDNHCNMRAIMFDDWSDQPSDQEACKYFEEEEL